jgi:hypothetical protein
MNPQVQNIFAALHDAGLTVTQKKNGRLHVAPTSRLTDELRELVRNGKADMLRWLATKVANELPEPSSETATWHELSAAYYVHHFTCETCIAAGQGYGWRCGVGASLWNPNLSVKFST